MGKKKFNISKNSPIQLVILFVLKYLVQRGGVLYDLSVSAKPQKNDPALCF